MQNTRWYEIAMILLLTAIWGSAFAFIKIALHTFTPWQLTLARFIPTIPAFALLVWYERKKLLALNRREWGLLTLGGLSATLLYNIALNTGETKVGAGLASLVISLNPAFIIGGAMLFHNERLKQRFLWGAVLAFSGVFVLTLSRDSFGFDRTALSGVLMILLCPLSWATYTLTTAALVKKTGALAVPAAAVLIGAITMLPFVPSAFPDGLPTDVTAWMVVFYLGYASTLLGFTIWAWLLARRGAARTGIVVYLNVVWGILFATMILGERIGWQTIVGAGLILTGVAISRNAS